MIDWTKFFNNSPATWGSWAPNQPAPDAYTGPVGNIGYGTGVGAYGPIPAKPVPQPDDGQGWANMARAGAALSQPQQINAPPLHFAQPVGPGQLPKPQPIPSFSPDWFARLRQSALCSGFAGS